MLWPHNINWEVICSLLFSGRNCVKLMLSSLIFGRIAIETIWAWSCFIEVAVSSKIQALRRSRSSSSLPHVHPYPWGAIQNVTTCVLIWIDGKSVHRQCLIKYKGYRRKLMCLGYFVERLVTSSEKVCSFLLSVPHKQGMPISESYYTFGSIVSRPSLIYIYYEARAI